MPTARAPLIFAIWPTAEPTAPDAADPRTAPPPRRLPRLRPTEVEQAHIGGHAGHAEHAQRGGDRRLLRVELSERAALGHRVALPADEAEHEGRRSDRPRH